MRIKISFCLLFISTLLCLTTCRTTKSADSTTSTESYLNSPFGIHGKTFDPGLPEGVPPGIKQDITTQYQKLGFRNANDWNLKVPLFMRDIGIHWDRNGLMFLSPETLFTRADILVQNANEMGINLVFTVGYQNRPVPGEAELIQKLVERYDGDGINDMPGLRTPVVYWQIGNEPEGKVSPEEYCALLRYGYSAVKQASPNCKMLLAGIEFRSSPFQDANAPSFLDTILGMGAGDYFDILDIHAFGNAQGDYRTIERKYLEAQKTFKKYGVTKDIWITETGTPSGTYRIPIPPGQLAQSEQAQAIDLVRRYMLSLGLGIKKVFWAWGLIDDWGFGGIQDGLFDHTGLIYNGLGKDDLGPFVKKLSFYAYKKMIEKLDGADWDKTSRLTNLPAGVDGVRFEKNGKPIYVLWSDNATPTAVTVPLDAITAAQVTITESVPKYNNGKQVKDYTTAFVTSTIAVKDKQVSLTLQQRPVYIE